MLQVFGGNSLDGTVKAQGAKNAALPIIVASLLTDEEVILRNVPRLVDVYKIIEMINKLGVNISWLDDNSLLKRKGNITKLDIECCENDIRYSLLLLGLLLGRFKYAKVPLPGGCKIGLRKYDMHLNGLRRLGAEIEEEEGFFIAKTNCLVGNDIDFYYPTFSGTQNICIAGTVSEGTTK